MCVKILSAMSVQGVVGEEREDALASQPLNLPHNLGWLLEMSKVSLIIRKYKHRASTNNLLGLKKFDVTL